MKLPRFDYARPKTLREAIGLLGATDGAKLLAGGQSLIPVMAYRLAAPPLLVDICDLEELTGITLSRGGVSLGARVRWCDIEADKRLQEAQPLLVAMISHVAHYQIRNRGTVGGSLAHADPAAEMPGFAVTCDVELVVMGSVGQRIVAAHDFFAFHIGRSGRNCFVDADAHRKAVAFRLPAVPLTENFVVLIE